MSGSSLRDSTAGYRSSQATSKKGRCRVITCPTCEGTVAGAPDPRPAIAFVNDCDDAESEVRFRNLHRPDVGQNYPSCSAAKMGA